MSELDIRQILDVLPHRFPILLIDRITELEPMVRVRGYKNITYNEPVFTGHFPGNPLFPGVYMLEAMAQLGDDGGRGFEDEIDVVSRAVLAVGHARKGFLFHFLHGLNLAASGYDFGRDFVDRLLDRFLFAGAVQNK